MPTALRSLFQSSPRPVASAPRGLRSEASSTGAALAFRRDELLLSARRSLPTPQLLSPPHALSAELSDSPVDAVKRALAGNPVQLTLRSGEKTGLALRQVELKGGQVHFDVGLGASRFVALVDAQADREQALGRLVAFAAHMPAALLRDVRALELKSLPENNWIIRLERLDGEGKSRNYTITRSSELPPAPVGCACPTCHAGSVCTAEPVQAGAKQPVSYKLSDGTDHLLVGTTPDGDDDWEVAQTILLWGQLPARLRHLLQNLHVVDGPNPTDGEWAKIYNMPGFSSAASGGNGAATFWNGISNLNAEVFFHEFGHVLGQAFSKTEDFAPADWAAAIKSDPEPVSNYAKASLNEDFAETVTVYLLLQQGRLPRVGNPPVSLADFEQRFPHRSAILKEIFEGVRTPVVR